MTQAAVSMALRGSAGVSPTTRERVLALARELGYRADPALAALTRRRWAGEHATIAYVGGRHLPEHHRDPYLEHITRRCDEVGLQLWTVPMKILSN